MSSYYGTSALDAYTGALTGYGGGSTRYESILDRKPYSSTYSSDYSLSGSSSRGNKSNNLSAYEKYCRGDYLSELTGLRTSAYTTAYRPPDTSYVDNILSDAYSTSKHRSTTPIPSSSSSNLISSRRKYVFEPESVDVLSNKFGSQSFYKTSGGYSNDTNNSSYLNDNDTSTYSSKGASSRIASRIGAIGSQPAFDRYGKELSNYERWKISQSGTTVDDESNNNKKNTRRNNETKNGTTNDNHSTFENKPATNDGFREIAITQNGNRVERDLRDSGRSSSGRIKSSMCDDTEGDIRKGNRLQKEREFSVIPTTNSSFRDWDAKGESPAITGSRFSGKTPGQTSSNMITSDSFSSGAVNRKSPPPSSYVPTVSSTSSSSYGTRPTHSFPSDVRSKVLNMFTNKRFRLVYGHFDSLQTNPNSIYSECFYFYLTLSLSDMMFVT